MEDEIASFSASQLGDLIVAVWRIGRRSARDPTTPRPVVIACESALDRIKTLGFRLDEMIDRPYDENMKLRVIYQESTALNPIITECISPAIYYNDILVKTAEVVIGGDTDGTTNS